MEKIRKELFGYDKKLAKREKDINKAVASAKNEIEDYADSQYEKEVKRVKNKNEAPCSICGKSEFVLKYRNVTGYIKGEVSGSFCLFGGSISGYVDGETKTKPVLSCRNCENERIIAIEEHEFSFQLVRDMMPRVWGYGIEPRKASEWLQEQGLEVAIGLEDMKFLWSEKRTPSNYSKETQKLVGLFEKFPKPEKPSFYRVKRKLCNTFTK